MTTTQPGGNAGPDRRLLLGGLLLLLLLLAASCAGYAAGSRDHDPTPQTLPAPHPTATAATPSPSSSTDVEEPETPGPAPTVTVTASASAGDPGSGGGGVAGSGSGTVDGGRARDFTMTATVSGSPLLIGEQHDLVVHVSNPNGRALDLLTIAVGVGTPSRAGCQASWLAVRTYDSGTDGAVTVAAHGSRDVTLTVELTDLPTVDQNACQGAGFPLSLTGTGRLA